MPSQEGGRGDEENRPAGPIQHPAQGGQRHPVMFVEAGPRNLAAEQLQLLAQDQYLDVFGAFAPAAQHRQLEDPADQLVEEPHAAILDRPTRIGWSGPRTEFSAPTRSRIVAIAAHLHDRGVATTG